jgi:Uma2 family endonuclease
MGQVKAHGLEGAADMVIEIASETSREYDVGAKRELYLRHGVGEYWVVDPEERKVRVYRRGRRERVVGRGRVESEVMRGFWVRAEWLWSEPLPAVAWVLDQIVGRSTGR